ncbi:MAG: hypothetical protein KGL53_03715, partial [Elusimicrobia bacterium]|nr:hypothetical protein [Elusimicrobiota bacterium]
MAGLGLLTLALSLAAAPARAQVAAGVGVTPEDFVSGGGASASTAAVCSPLALALSLAFDSTTWAAVGVSTEAPAGEMAELLARGYYRDELLLLTLIAKDSGKRLLDLRTRRTKDGRSLRQLAEEAKLPFDALYDEAYALG